MDLLNRGDGALDLSALPTFKTQLLDAVGQAVIATDLDGRITYWNRAAEELYGWKASEVIGHDILDITSTETSREQARARIEALRGGESWTGEVSVRRRDGSTFYAHATGTPIRDEEGHIVGIIGVSYDITEERQKREQLDEERNRLFQAFEHVPACILTLRGPNHIVEMANAAALEFSGKRNVLGRPIAEVMPEVEAQGFLDIFNSVFRTGEPFVGTEVPYTFPPTDSGEERTAYFNYACQPLRDGSLRVTGLLVHAVDVTEQVLGKRSVEQAYRSKRLIMKHSLDVICTIDTDGRFAKVSAASEALWGYQPEELVGRRYLDLVHHEGREATRAAMEVIMEGHTERSLENHIVRKDGSPVPMLWSAVWSQEDGLMFCVGRDITGLHTMERERAEALRRLRHSEARFRGLVQNSSEVITLISETGVVQYQSPTIERVLGYTPEELVGTNAFELVHPEDLPTVKGAIGRALAGEREVHAVFRFVNADGQWRWFESRAVNLLEDEAVGALVVSSRDITENREQQEKLKQRDALLQAAADVAHILAVEEDFDRAMTLALQHIGKATKGDWVYLFENHVEPGTDELLMSQRFGWVDDDVCLASDDDERQNLRVDDILSERLSVLSSDVCVELPGDAMPTSQCRLLGCEFLNSMLVVPIITKDEWYGSICVGDCSRGQEWSQAERAVLSTIADTIGGMLKRAEAEKALQDSEQRLRLALDATSMGTWEWDGRDEQIRCSPVTYDLLGIEEDDLSSWERWYECVHPDDRERVRNESALMLETTGEMNVEVRVVHPDGDVRWINGRGRAYHDSDGNLRRVTGLVLDITDQKRYEQELLRAKVQAEEMSRLKDAFLANMSHEIRTPLTTIIGFADLLAEEATEEVQLHAQMIRRGGERLMMTLDSVLDLAKLESQTVKLNMEEIDLVDQVGSFLRLFYERARERRLRLTFTHEEDQVYARVDKGALTRILSNLVSNALKFTEQGGVTVHVRQSCSGAQIQVEDTGIGISSEFVPYLFTEFAQESSGLSRSFEGVGLGLTITARLVELMHGTISVESEKGRGTTFTVTFPDGAERQSSQPNPAEKDHSRVAACSILVVEDQEETQYLLEQVLSEDHAVTCVSSGEEALRIADGASFDLVLVDVNLGVNMTGVEVMRSLRQRPAYATVPIVACTAYALPGDASRLKKAGFDAYLPKPFKRGELLTLVNRLFEDT